MVECDRAREGSAIRFYSYKMLIWHSAIIETSALRVTKGYFFFFFCQLGMKQKICQKPGWHIDTHLYIFMYISFCKIILSYFSNGKCDLFCTRFTITCSPIFLFGTILTINIWFRENRNELRWCFSSSFHLPLIWGA